VIVYVEIKFRSSDRYGDPLEAVDVRKQKRISRVAAYHYARYGAQDAKPCRFDVIGIYGNGCIRHIENAFEYC
jgi:putative endonuclease